MQATVRNAVLLASAAILMAGLYDVRPARSDPFRAIIGGAAGAFLGGMGYRSHGGGHARRHSKNSDDDDSSSKPRSRSQDDRVLASLGAPSAQRQTVILKSIDITGDAGAVGSKGIVQIGVTQSEESQRDYIGQINEIIVSVKSDQNKNSDAGEVTQHAIEQSLDRAFKDSKLTTFESFVGENWSAERLRTMILRRVRLELEQQFKNNNNRVVAPMKELDDLIRRSAETIYHRLFETSELLAANRSTALFAQRLYQTHGGLVDDQLREVSDHMLMQAANSATLRYESLMRRDEDGVALRYRAERIVLDCLSENITKITSSETGIATVGEIEQRIQKAASGECAVWLENQFGKDKDKLVPQKPMPLRTVWSPAGPRDDPSMYGRVSRPL